MDNFFNSDSLNVEQLTELARELSSPPSEKSLKRSSSKGFTLAKVLITLTVIGVVAALTIPTLLQNSNQEELNVAWKRAFADARQAYIAAVNENGGGLGDYSCTPSVESEKWNVFKSKFNIIKECNDNNYGNCWSDGGTSPNQGPGWTGFMNHRLNYGKGFVDSSGRSWKQYTWGPGGICGVVAIDVNGLKKPNKWGEDVNVIGFFNTKISPVQENGTLGISKLYQ